MVLRPAPRSPTRRNPCLPRAWTGAWTRPGGWVALDLYHDGQHHRAPLEPFVDERRQIVVQNLLEQVRLADLLLGGAVQRRLDGGADLVEQRLRVLRVGDAAKDDLGLRHRRAVL